MKKMWLSILFLISTPVLAGTTQLDNLVVRGTTNSTGTITGPGSGITSLNASNISSGTMSGARLPTPGASTLGGTESLTCSSHQWFEQLSTSGVPSCTQPAFSDISGSVAATQLPNPSGSTLGGTESLTCSSHQWWNTLSTSGVPGCTQPGASDLSDGTSGTGAVVRVTNAALVTPALGTPSALVGTNITGTASGLTAGNVTTNANLTGPITSSGNATSIASQTGTGSKFVVDTGPTIAGPTLTGTTTFPASSSIDSSGNLTMKGSASTIGSTSSSNGYIFTVQSNSSGGANYAGVHILAGSSLSNEFPFTVSNAANTVNYFSVFGNGNAQVQNKLIWTGSSSGTVSIDAPATVTPYGLHLPAAQSGVNQYFRNDGSGNLSWAASTSTLSNPTVTKELSGTGTYTVPTSPGPIYVEFVVIGAGGGGSGGGLGGGSATAGGESCISSGSSCSGTVYIAANGGTQGTTATGTMGGAGGTATITGGPLGLPLSGEAGGPGIFIGIATATMNVGGGNGGGFGGGSGGVGVTSAIAGVANSGGGGGGGGCGVTSASCITGSGGGHGGYASVLFPAPGTTYAYSVGAGGSGGTAGTGGGAGGAGAAGSIVVRELYQ